jgi:hypothetical protein
MKQAAVLPETLKPLNIYISENQCDQWAMLRREFKSSKGVSSYSLRSRNLINLTSRYAPQSTP